jgi:uncharacterized protein YbjT (DUF2867 family)
MFLVIGSSGFIGKHVVKQLSEKYPGQVRAMVRKSSNRDFLNQLQGIEIVEGNVLDPESLKRAVQGVDIVLYFAAITGNIKNVDNIYWKVNVEGTRNAVAAAEAAGVKRFVLGSGLGTIEGKSGTYMITRWEMEQAVRKSKLAWTIIQPSIVFGEGSEFFEAQARVMKSLPVAAVIGGGKTRFQPVFVDDVARASIIAAERDDKIGQTIAVGGPEYFTYNELINMILRTTKLDRFKLPLPMWLAKANATMFSVLPKPPLTNATLELFAFDNVTPDPQVIEHEFGFKPEPLKQYLDEHGIRV